MEIDPTPSPRPVSHDGAPPHDPNTGEYDGIHENNHPLPKWWQWIFWGAAVFALLYWLDYEGLKAQPGPREEYQREMAAAAQAKLAGGEVTAESLVALSKDPSALAGGKSTFTTICAACHKPDGSGDIGPNLTDAYWLHGGKPKDIYKTVHDGIDGKGMQAWAPTIGEKKVAQVVAYVLSLKNTNLSGKAPQGEKEEN